MHKVDMMGLPMKFLQLLNMKSSKMQQLGVTQNLKAFPTFFQSITPWEFLDNMEIHQRVYEKGFSLIITVEGVLMAQDEEEIHRTQELFIKINDVNSVSWLAMITESEPYTIPSHKSNAQDGFFWEGKGDSNRVIKCKSRLGNFYQYSSSILPPQKL